MLEYIPCGQFRRACALTRLTTLLTVRLLAVDHVNV
jgi:hypothetical protein